MKHVRPASLLVLLPLIGCEQGFSVDGPPVLLAGTGEYAFAPVDDGQEVPLIDGPQGGFHVWLGVAVENMNPNDMHLDVDLFDVKEDEYFGEPLFFDFTMFDGETGDFEFAGLPAQMRKASAEGKLVRIEVTATDKDGRTTDAALEVIPVLP